jgi:hypothetical protein
LKKAQLLSLDFLVAGALLVGAYAMISHVAEFSFVGGQQYPQGISCVYEHCVDGSVSTDCGEMPCSDVFVEEHAVFYEDAGLTCLRSERQCG